MQRYGPALKVLVLICVVFLAVLTALGLVFGAEKPFWAVMPMLFGLFSFYALSTWAFATPDCPVCGTRQPAMRKPASLRQTLLGGWTCASCGTELDRNGKAIDRAA